ncbi:MAG: TIGR02594 family protein [Moraxellaceae bacterium]|nr:MAG: TIGR02594 family protein [Moraxellaceae bacterium]
MVKPELKWIEEGRKYVGLREKVDGKPNPIILEWLRVLKAWWFETNTPWCGVFIAHCLSVAGVQYPKHWYRALDYLNYGARLSRPAYGCVAIKSRKGGGHVTFVVGQTSSGRLVCLGGNQGDMVSYAVYSASDFEQFRWFGKTLTPAPIRYNLPIIDSVTATKVRES